jgi:hypothetical protein
MHAPRTRYDHLVRAFLRAEVDTLELAERTSRRLGDVPPARALRAVAEHAVAGGDRLVHMLAGYGIARAPARSRMSKLTRWIAFRLVDPEHGYRDAADELKRGMELARQVRAMARTDGLFGLIRWCDDWLPARRLRVASVEAQQAWFVSPGMAPPLVPVAADPVQVGEIVTMPRFLDWM